eukprot:6857801-Alexandrium_andersonii.AAC.1
MSASLVGSEMCIRDSPQPILTTSWPGSAPRPPGLRIRPNCCAGVMRSTPLAGNVCAGSSGMGCPKPRLARCGRA